jgi:transketolase
MRDTFVKCLMKRAASDDSIFVVTPDMGFSVFETFIEKYPERFLNVGIAEQNAIGVACGLALSGKKVYVYSIIPFVTMRCFEQVRIDVSFMRTNVKLVGVGAGLTYGAAGPSHHAIEDIAVMRALPNMTVCCPGDPVETRELITQSFDYEGPMYIRLGKNKEKRIHQESTKIEFGKAATVTEGDHLVLFTTSNMLEEGKKIADEYESTGKNITLISMHTMKPIDEECIKRMIQKKIPIVTLEEHNLIGGLGSAVAEVIAESGQAVNFRRIAINDSFCRTVGSHACLRKKMGLAIDT